MVKSATNESGTPRPALLWALIVLAAYLFFYHSDTEYVGDEGSESGE